MRLSSIAAFFIVLLGRDAALANGSKDAAEAVQEGSVKQWLDYYKRERGPQSSGPSSASGETKPAADAKSPPTEVVKKPN